MRKTLILLYVILACFATAHPFAGAGVNTHGQLLPVRALKSIGIRWVRAEMRVLSREKVQAFLRHYAEFKVVWMVMQESAHPEQDAANLAAWGVTELELGNEPELPDLNGRRMVGQEYGRWASSIVKRLRGRARAYGPATGTWNPAYALNAARAGFRPSCVSFHGYWLGAAKLRGVFRECRERFGVDAVCTEVGFPSRLGAVDYPLGGAPAHSFVQLASALGDLPWCFYDGPGDLFATGDGGYSFTVETQTFEAIRGLLAASATEEWRKTR